MRGWGIVYEGEWGYTRATTHVLADCTGDEAATYLFSMNAVNLLDFLLSPTRQVGNYIAKAASARGRSTSISSIAVGCHVGCREPNAEELLIAEEAGTCVLHRYSTSLVPLPFGDKTQQSRICKEVRRSTGGCGKDHILNAAFHL